MTQTNRVLDATTLARALAEVDKAGGHHGAVPLSDLRRRLAGYGRRAVDAALMEGQRMGLLRLEKGGRMAGWTSRDPFAGLPTARGLMYVARRVEVRS